MPVQIIYKINSQKMADGFKECLSDAILTDICSRLYGETQFEVIEETLSYNKGRLIKVINGDMVNFVSISEPSNQGRNSSLQSVPTAINQFYADPALNKRLYYYFLPTWPANPTNYHKFIYQLMATAGILFLNFEDHFGFNLERFNTIDDIIANRNINRSRNTGNASSFITKAYGRVQIYAKTYGANKYESTLMAVAASKIAGTPIDIYAISEQNLTSLPQPSLVTFGLLGNITVRESSLKLPEKQGLEAARQSLRSGAYNFNLLDRLGPKECAFCGCAIPEIIHGAHIWSVKEIRKAPFLNPEEKYAHATNGHNGLWLCANHHGLFDNNALALNDEGAVLVKSDLPNVYREHILKTTYAALTFPEVLSPKFKGYLERRNSCLDLRAYQEIRTV